MASVNIPHILFAPGESLLLCVFLGRDGKNNPLYAGICITCTSSFR